jgi:hypothetical protein
MNTSVSAAIKIMSFKLMEKPHFFAEGRGATFVRLHWIHADDLVRSRVGFREV